MRRVFDICGSLILIIVFFPIIILITILLKISSKGPVLFWAPRLGLNERSFEMPKFRTYKVGTPILASNLIEDPESLYSPMGRFLRRFSIDELPQLYCILKGEMSFIGPRPCLDNQEDLISLRREHDLFSIKPGVSGWAQVNGRDEISLEKKIELDLEYLNKRSFFFDFKIIWMTIVKVLKSDNISH